jgi:hypothetical protein
MFVKKNNYFIVDPHFTDEIYTPLRFYIRKRKGLNKYSYLSNVCENERGVNILFSNTISGVINSSLFEKLPILFKRFIILIESKFWLLLNKIKVSKLTTPKASDIAIVQLRNITPSQLKYIDKLRDLDVIIAWGTSHLHLAAQNLSYIKPVDLVLIDNNLNIQGVDSSHLIISPPVVKDRFINLHKARINKILCVGTVHVYKAFHHGFYKSAEIFTLHPARYKVLSNRDESINSILLKNYSVISDDLNLYQVQRKYLKQDIVSLYNDYRFAFIGSENTGVVALGTYEAMACGCEVFLEEHIAKKVGLIDGVHVWTFRGTAESLRNKFDEIISEQKVLDHIQIKNYCAKLSIDSLTTQLKISLAKKI